MSEDKTKLGTLIVDFAEYEACVLLPKLIDIKFQTEPTELLEPDTISRIFEKTIMQMMHRIIEIITNPDNEEDATKRAMFLSSLARNNDLMKYIDKSENEQNCNLH